MNYLLFQPAILSEADKVFLNGEIIEDPTRKSEVYDCIVSIFNHVKTNNYPYFDKVGNYYVIRGLFEAKDEKGRVLSFLFASDSENYCEELSNVSKIIGLKIDTKTLAAINHPLIQGTIKLTKKFLLPVIICLVFIIIISLVVCNTFRTC